MDPLEQALNSYPELTRKQPKHSKAALGVAVAVIVWIAGFIACAPPQENPPEPTVLPTLAPATPLPAPTPVTHPSVDPMPPATPRPAPTASAAPTPVPTPTAAPTSTPTPTATSWPTPTGLTVLGSQQSPKIFVLPTPPPGLPGVYVGDYPDVSPDNQELLCGQELAISDTEQLSELSEYLRSTKDLGLRLGEDVAGFVDWTPDSATVLFNHRSWIQAVDVSGSRLQTVVDANPRNRFFMHGVHADVSPNGSRMVYTTCEFRTEEDPEVSGGWDDYNYEVAMVDVDGGNPERYTENKRLEHFPAWSPDMTKLAFVKQAVYYHWLFNELHVVSGESLEQTDLIVRGDIPLYTPPVWSPDGRYLAFTAWHERKLILNVVRTDGSELRIVSGYFGRMAWSPDSRRMAIIRQEGEDAVLLTIAVDGSDPKPLVKMADAYRGWLNPLAWSPDGNYILYGCEAGLCVVDLEGNAVGQSPKGWIMPDDRPHAAWSPDGSLIAVRTRYHPYEKGGIAVFTMAPDGGEARILVRGGRSPFAESSRYHDVQYGVASCSGGFVVPSPGANPGLVRDCEVLMGLRDALMGDGVLNWSAGTPLDDWDGVVLGGAPLRVTGLQFPLSISHLKQPEEVQAFRLNGVLPPALGELEQLETLVIISHRLKGRIPPELGKLTNLRVLRIVFNGYTGVGKSLNLHGNIPPELGELSNLRVLNLRGNSFLEGTIPPELGKLGNLRVLNLAQNNLEGSIPPELGMLGNLQFLSLARNELTGSIPPELGNLTSLEKLDLVWFGKNEFSVCISEVLPEIWVEATGLERCTV